MAYLFESHTGNTLLYFIWNGDIKHYLQTATVILMIFDLGGLYLFFGLT